MDASSLPYHEPSIIQVLILSSFGLLLNLVNWALEQSIYCGLVGQILIGVFWGTPLGGWLDSSIEHAVVQLGYLGLILLVYEGGLSTSLAPLLSNLPLSLAVATTGILLPIALSFILMPLVPGTTPLQSFAAGAALSATSLGTTFSILTASGFARTRLGVVLTSAAMMDDVVGLVMIQVVAELGSGAVSGGTVGRPVGASVGLLVFVVVGCRWGVGPVYRRFLAGGELGLLGGGERAFLVHSGVLVALVAGASYAGTSVLFAAFLAGAAVSWWDKMVSQTIATPTSSEAAPEPEPKPELSTPGPTPEVWTGARVYEHYYAPPVTRILVPFFFASIGFSIPITQLFKGSTVWRGLVYAFLMALGKFMTGIWLLRFSLPGVIAGPVEKLRLIRKLGLAGFKAAGEKPKSPPPPQKPRSLYPPAIIGLAMIARGEIGFLIASVAEARGIFMTASAEGRVESSELYLVVIWATVLCTLLGPVAVGFCVRRVKALERERVERGGGGGVLGAWGVGEGSG